MTIQFIMVSASRQGGALTRASAQLDLTFTFGELKQGERVSLGPASPQLSALHEMSDYPLTMDKTGQRGLLTLKVPGGIRVPTLFIVQHLSTPTLTSQGSELCLSCFM